MTKDSFKNGKRKPMNNGANRNSKFSNNFDNNENTYNQSFNYSTNNRSSSWQYTNDKQRHHSITLSNSNGQNQYGLDLNTSMNMNLNLNLNYNNQSTSELNNNNNSHNAGFVKFCKKDKSLQNRKNDGYHNDNQRKFSRSNGDASRGDGRRYSESHNRNENNFRENMQYSKQNSNYFKSNHNETLHINKSAEPTLQKQFGQDHCQFNNSSNNESIYSNNDHVISNRKESFKDEFCINTSSNNNSSVNASFVNNSSVNTFVTTPSNDQPSIYIPTIVSTPKPNNFTPKISYSNVLKSSPPSVSASVSGQTVSMQSTIDITQAPNQEISNLQKQVSNVQSSNLQPSVEVSCVQLSNFQPSIDQSSNVQQSVVLLNNEPNIPTAQTNVQFMSEPISFVDSKDNESKSNNTSTCSNKSNESSKENRDLNRQTSSESKSSELSNTVNSKLSNQNNPKFDKNKSMQSIKSNYNNKSSQNRSNKNKSNQNASHKTAKDKLNKDTLIKPTMNTDKLNQITKDESSNDNSNESIVSKDGSFVSSNENSFSYTILPRGTPEDQVISKPKETIETSISKLENKIDNLKISDTEPPVGKQSTVETPVSKLENKIDNSKISDTETPVDKIKSQSSTNQPQQTTSSTVELQKKSSLDGCQSKSDSKNISYDFEFLKSLQHSDMSKVKPNFNSDLEDKVEILLKTPRSKNDNIFNDSFEPMYNRNNSSNNNNRFLTGRAFNSMQMGNRMNSDNKIRKIISSNSLTQDVKLRTTENAWKPGLNKNQSNEETCEALIKKARGMLNKLTPQNYERISNQFRDARVIKIDTLEKLRKIIELIFEKAVDEPAFCEQYAMLCKDMSTISVTLEADQKPTKFNTLLLEKCQTCFEADKYKDIDISGREEEIDKCTDKEKKQQLIDELDEEKRLIRKKSLGNIKLIGALYKNNRLKDEIMDLCIETLINNDDEDSYECLCSLLKSIGEKFEASFSNKNKFISHMKQLEQVVKTGKIASRIKFMIMDVLDMRKDNWKPRKLQDVNKPKTIEQVHEDAKKQEEQSNREISQSSIGKNRNNDQMKKRNDNWMQSSSRKSQQSNENAMSNLRKLAEQRQNNPNEMSPSFNQFSLTPKFHNSWSQGASVKSSLSGSNDKRTNQNTASRNENRLDDSRSSSKKSPFRGTYTANNEQKDYELIKQYTGFIKKYCSSLEINSLINSIYDISTEECVHLFVVSAIHDACESLLKQIDLIGEMLADLVITKRIISYPQFHKGLKHHLDTSQDVITDVPKFFEYIGQILSHFYFKISDDERKSFFKETLQPCLVHNSSIKIIGYVIKYAIARENEADVIKKWSLGKMYLTDFSNKQSEEELEKLLIEDCKLDKFIDGLNNSKCINEKEIELSNLCQRILNNNSSFDELPKLLEQHFDSNEKESNKKLISALIERCIKDSTDHNDTNKSFNKEQFESRIKNFPLFEQLESEMQLEVIYTSIKINEYFSQPKDFLLNIFTFFNDLKLVDKKVFIQWANENKSCIPGNAIAMISTKRFIEKLKSDSS